MGAIQFIENLDRTSLTISDEEFERKVEAAVSTITERNLQYAHSEESADQSVRQGRVIEKSSHREHDLIHPNSAKIEPRLTPQTVFREKLVPGPGRDGSEEDNAVNGLLRSIQRPLSNLGKIFSEEPSHNAQPSASPATSLPPQRLSPAVFQPPPSSNDSDSEAPQTLVEKRPISTVSRNYNAEDAAARQASAEAAEAERIQQAEHRNVVE